MVEPHEVAGRVTESTVTNAVLLVHGFLKHFGAAGTHPFERGVTVGVAIEDERLVVVVDGEEAVVQLDVHTGHAAGRVAGVAPPFLMGLVRILTKQAGMDAAAPWLRAR